VRAIKEWFDDLWRKEGTRRITAADLRAAQLAYNRARAAIRSPGSRAKLEAGLAAVIHARDLAPLSVKTLSGLPCWREPTDYPPFSRQTRRFLEDFGLLQLGASAASPAAYVRWLDQARNLSQELDLPTTGHVDRMVWEHSPRD
jgi:hypothetical protein